MRLIFTFILTLFISTVFAQSATILPGDLRSSNLAGTGNRDVYADPSGKLQAGPRTYTMVIPPQAFQRRNRDGAGTFVPMGSYGDCYMFGATAENLVAPIILPVGATITRTQVYFADNNANNNLRFIFTSAKIDGTGNSTIVSLFQNTNNPLISDISSITSSALNQIVSVERTYYILILPVDTTDDNLGTWGYSGGSTNYMSVKGVRITYTF